MSKLKQLQSFGDQPQHYDLIRLQRDCEHHVIGEVLLRDGAFHVAANYLSPANFEDTLCREVWVICEDLATRHLPIDYLMVSQRISAFKQIWVTNGRSINLEDRSYSREMKLYQLGDIIARVNSARHLSFHSIQLVEICIRRYLTRTIMKIFSGLSPSIQGDVIELLESLNLVKGPNDILELLETSLEYFRMSGSNQMRKSIEGCIRIINLKAAQIKRRDGWLMIEKTMKYYNRLSA